MPIQSILIMISTKLQYGRTMTAKRSCTVGSERESDGAMLSRFIHSVTIILCVSLAIVASGRVDFGSNGVPGSLSGIDVTDPKRTWPREAGAGFVAIVKGLTAGTDATEIN